MKIWSQRCIYQCPTGKARDWYRRLW